MTPDDTLAIQRLYAEYNHAIHRRDGAAWADCFMADGVFSNRAERVTGREALSVYADGFSKAVNARYWIDNLLLESTPEGASGSCYLMLFHTGAGGVSPTISLTGVYTDRLTKVDGQWKFAARHIARDV